MKTNLIKRARTGSFAILAASVLTFLSGCLMKTVVWSPDGTRAAVITDAGLYLCDASGHLSPLLVPGVLAAAWLGDSEHLVLTRERGVDSWAAIADALGDERAAEVAAEAGDVWNRVQQGALWSVVMMGRGNDRHAMEIFLREQHAADLRAKSGDAWEGIAAARVKLQEVVPAHIVGERIEVGAALYVVLNDIIEIRPSPDGRAVAVVSEMGGGDDNASIHIAMLDDSMPVVALADNTAAYPDWTADGRSLIYVQSVGGAAADNDLSLGALVSRRVRDASGAIDIAEDSEELAGLMFSVFARVRCLSDGRIVFNAAELCLPLAARDAEVERERLFVLDPVRQATLVRVVPRKTEIELPEVLAFFEVSPDEAQILFGGTEGEVCVLELASGDVEVIQKADDGIENAPVWRRAGELTYYKRALSADPEKPNRAAEVVLRYGEEETVLSQNWPDEMIRELIHLMK